MYKYVIQPTAETTVKRAQVQRVTYCIGILNDDTENAMKLDSTKE